MNLKTFLYHKSSWKPVPKTHTSTLLHLNSSTMSKDHRSNPLESKTKDWFPYLINAKNVREPLQALLADTYSVRDTKVHENGKVSSSTKQPTNQHKPALHTPPTRVFSSKYSTPNAIRLPFCSTITFCKLEVTAQNRKRNSVFPCLFFYFPFGYCSSIPRQRHQKTLHMTKWYHPVSTSVILRHPST